MIAVLAMMAMWSDARVGPSDRRIADMLQLTVDLDPAASPEERSKAIALFERDTAQIRSCTDARQLAVRYERGKRFKPTVTTRANYQIGWMPPYLRDQLNARPSGRATTVFGEGPTQRVLFACTTPKLPPDGMHLPIP